MTIPTIEYSGYELRSYSHQEYPLHVTRMPKVRGDFHLSCAANLLLSRYAFPTPVKGDPVEQPAGATLKAIVFLFSTVNAPETFRHGESGSAGAEA